MPLIPVLRKQRQAEHSEFEANLVCIWSFKDSQDYILRPFHAYNKKKKTGLQYH